MLAIETTVLPSPEQWEIIVEGMRNPKNSWDKMDSEYTWVEDPSPINPNDPGLMFVIGDNDKDLMLRLANGGPVHAKYRRMIPVYVTINAPLYWWKEFDTYKVGTVANSCSTMHKIHAKEFEWDDFSFEKLLPDEATDFMEHLIEGLNFYRRKYLETKEKQYWWQLIQLLPTSYNQRRTVMLNYEVLTNIYHSRRNHKLDEWHTFCDWIEKLPHSELITSNRGEDDDL